MDERLDRVEASLLRLEGTLLGLEARVAHLEARVGEAPRPIGADAAALVEIAQGGVAPPVGREQDVAGLLSLAGRTLLVLGGAYVLRALTDGEALPRGAGVAFGLVYAAAWLGAAHASAGERSTSATFHGGVGLAIGMPLVWEATTRFGLLSPAWGAVALAALTAGGLVVAWHKHLHLLAWLATGGALAAAIALMVTTGAYLPVAVFTISLGLAALWLGYDRDWFGLRWVVALPANVLVVMVTSRALAGREDPATALGVQLLLVAAYLGVIAARTLVRGRSVIPFEVAQTIVGSAVGLGGAVALVRASGSGMVPLGVASLGLGVATYAVAFAFVDRRQGHGLNFYYYATFALALTLVGGTLLLAGQVAALLWAGLAVASCVLGRRLSRLAFALHGAVYVVAAAWTSGLAASAASALTAQSTAVWPAPTLAAWTVLFAIVACAVMLPPDPTGRSDGIGRMPRVTVATLLLVSAAGLIVAWLVSRFAGTPGVDADPGIVATLRTVVLASVAVAVAWAGRHARFPDVGWALYPILVLTAVKLVVEDFPRSRPATLFVALAAYGVALILAPRLGRGARVE